jgi:prevent-host-death family protein
MQHVHLDVQTREVSCMQEVSIAEAKARLPGLIHQVESGAPVQITRRGVPVAVLLSESDYAALQARPPAQGLWDTISEWRRQTGCDDLPDLAAEEVDAWRDRDAGPGFQWPE